MLEENTPHKTSMNRKIHDSIRIFSEYRNISEKIHHPITKHHAQMACSPATSTMKPQKRFHSGKANLSLLRKNTQTKRGARPINRLNERESGNPAAPPPLLPTEGPFPTPTAQRCARTAKTAIRAQQRTGTNKKAAPKRETAFSRPQQTFLKQCALPQSKKSSHRRNHVTLSRNALRKNDHERAPLPGPSPPHSSIIP